MPTHIALGPGGGSFLMDRKRYNVPSMLNLPQICLTRNSKIWVYCLFSPPMAVKQTSLIGIPHPEGWGISTMMRSKWANDVLMALLWRILKSEFWQIIRAERAIILSLRFSAPVFYQSMNSDCISSGSTYLSREGVLSGGGARYCGMPRCVVSFLISLGS